MNPESPQKAPRDKVLLGIMQRVLHKLPRDASNAALEAAKQSEQASYKQLEGIDPNSPAAQKVLADLEQARQARQAGNPSPSLLHILGLDESASNEEILDALAKSARDSSRRLLDLGEEASDEEVEEKLAYYWEIYK
ncbi:MAG: hypothetical protein PHU71_04985 [Candidatus Gracilibacteria bacterium]|nr:hypothetical protein [Candidatus Gracilibacteria bacterium]